MRRSFVYVVPFAALALVAGACGRFGAGPTAPSVGPSPAVGWTAPGEPGAAISPRGLPLGDLLIDPDGSDAASGPAKRAAVQLEVEIADTPEASARGLMGVEHLSDEQGMVFLSAEPSTVPFWMKDTLLPLDIAFWDRNGRIFDIQQMQPCSVPEGQLAEAVCPRYDPSGSYVGALEVNLGLLERSGVNPGARVRLEWR